MNEQGLVYYDYGTYLRLVLSLFVDAVLSLFPFVAGFYAGDNRTDLNLLQWTGEVCIEGKCVGGLYITPMRMFL